MGWHTHSLTIEGEKNPQKLKWCKGSHSPPPTSRPVPSQTPSNGYFGKTPPPNFIAERDVTCYGVSLGHLGSAILAVPPHNLLLTPPACLLEARGRMMLALDAAQALSAIAKILVCFQHCLVTNLNHSTIQGVGKKNNSIPVKLSTICKKNFSPPRYSFCRHSLYDSPLGYQQPEEQTPKLEEAHDH